MTRRIFAIILTCITILVAAMPLSACAPQPAEPTLAQKVKDAVILEYKGGESPADLGIENLIPAADSQEFVDCLDKMRKDTGQTDEEGNLIYKYNFDYINEVMQSDAATIDNSIYNALIISFTNMSDEDKEVFLKNTYIKTEQEGLFGSTFKWNVSPVLGGMAARYKNLLKNANVPYDMITNQDNRIYKCIYSYSLLNQISQWQTFESTGGLKVIVFSIEKNPESNYTKWDRILSVGYLDSDGNIQTEEKADIYQFRKNLDALITNTVSNAAKDRNLDQLDNAVNRLKNEGVVSYALLLGASINMLSDGNYSINVVSLDKYDLNIALRAYAIKHGGVSSDGLGLTAEDIEETFINGTFDIIEIDSYVAWYGDGGGLSPSDNYEDALRAAINKDIELKGVNLSFEEKRNRLSDLTYEDMVGLEKDYPECFNYQK